MNASLTIEFPNKNESQYVILLPGQEVYFGRDSSNDVSLALFPTENSVLKWATADISRRHFVIIRKKDGYAIRDLGSTNGTSVDCIALVEGEKDLKDGQIIDVGGVLELKVKIKENSLWLYRITNTPQEAYLIFNKKITIGSAKNNDLVLHSSKILPYHAKIWYDGNNYWIASLERKAIIKINNTFISNRQCLYDEENIVIGDIYLSFKIEG